MFAPIWQYKLSDSCEWECNPCKLWQRDTQEEFPAMADVVLDLEALQKRGIRYINFYGGDPLLHPNIVEILGRAKKMGFKNFVTTPGENYLAFQTGLKDQADLMIFLWQGHLAQIHDQIAGANSFAKVLAAIDYAKEHKQKVMISYNVTRDNIQNIPEAYELATAKKVLLWLNPLPVAFGFRGFSADSIGYLKYYGKRPNAWVNLASLWYLANDKPKLREREDCIAKDDIITQAFNKFGLLYILNLRSFFALQSKLARQR